MGRGAASRAGLLLLALGLLAQVAAQQVRIGGSSTLYPASVMFASDVEESLPEATFQVTFAGTAGGFELLCRGAVELIGASRLATEEERDACSAAGVEFVAFPVAIDAVVLVVSERNDWLGCLEIEEVRRLWSDDPAAPDSWSDLRPEWPDAEIEFHAPGVASGTYDYWNRRVLGGDLTMRTDYFPSEDDRQLAQAVASHPEAIAFFGRAHLNSAGGIRPVAIDDGFGCLDPNEAGAVGRWPFIRPLFLYVSAAAAAPGSEARAAVSAVVETYLSPAGQGRLSRAGYLPLGEQVRRDALARFRDRIPGPLVADYGGKSILRSLPGSWSQRQVDLRSRLALLESEVEPVGVVHRRFEALLQGLLDGARSSVDDPP